jgi:hypothetical protein
MHNINKQVPPKAGIQQAWAEVIPDFFSQQQETLNELVKERLVECLAPHEQYRSADHLGKWSESMCQEPKQGGLRQDFPSRWSRHAGDNTGIVNCNGNLER